MLLAHNHSFTINADYHKELAVTFLPRYEEKTYGKGDMHTQHEVDTSSYDTLSMVHAMCMPCIGT